MIYNEIIRSVDERLTRYEWRFSCKACI